ncbi:hypothetical protein HWC07_gp013 [Pantoea phage vB_PagM_LIET2]|uniref:Uncharacterized protein n=1 Tax=Pantoea phage vB_PagM_LIET2 TaxID=2508071 RepID=A0A411AW16_9CAUD|nr:hypothetical protein HWC07_gp013 [Pantoea phage vB_PagM_LIET2]QAX92265.1 hypothetical protein LIET2_gp013 [Pantoea phage vB_PagM_LIET2]
MSYTYQHESFTECVLVGGPFDGRRETIDDRVDQLRLWVVADSLSHQFEDMSMPVTHDMRTVTYYRKQLTAEGLRKPLSIFVTDREASTGWLIQRILLAYPEPKGND